jgi:hypothetical protein
LTAQIKSEEDRTRVLTAEWHQLKNPERLEALVKRHMPELDSVSPPQLASLVDIPDRLPSADVPVAEAPAPKLTEPPKEKTLAVKVSLAKKVAPPVRPHIVPIVQKVKPTPPRDELAELISRHGGDDDEVLTVIDHEPPRGVLWANAQEMR